MSCVAISRDGKLIATGERGGIIRVRNTDTGEEENVVPDGGEYVGSLAFGADNTWLVCAGYQTVRYHSLISGSPGKSDVRELRYKDLDNSWLHVLSNDVVMVLWENCVEAWDRLNECIWKSFVPHRQKHRFDFRNEILVDPSETRLVLGLDKGRLGIWALADGELLRIVSQDIPRPGSVAGLFGESRPEIPYWGKTVWNAPGGPYFHVGCDLYGRAVHLQRSADGKYTLTDLEDEVVMVALDGKGGVVRRMPIRDYTKAMCISDDRLLVLNRDGELFLQEFEG